MRHPALANAVARIAGILIGGGLIGGGAALSMIPVASAAPLGSAVARDGAASAGSGVVRVQSTICTELRRACLYKRELGEKGQGNCSKYRAECVGSRPSSSSYYHSYRSYGYRPSGSYYRRGYWD